MSDFTENIDYLKQRLRQQHLPGKEIQYQMAPPERPYDYPENINYENAAVSLMLYNKNGETYFPLIQRTAHNHNDKHKGQISLPGGKYDKTDTDLLDCAVRELEEELGIEKKEIIHLGNLTDIFIPVSGFRVHPFVLYAENNVNFVPQPEEVQYILEVNIKDLIDKHTVKIGKIILDMGMELENIPYFLLNDHIVWGATAMILNEFKKVITDF